MRTETDQTIYLKDYQPTPYGIAKVVLDVQFWPDRTVIGAALQVTRRANTKPGTPLRLDGDGLTLRAISVNGSGIAGDAYLTDSTGLTLHEPPAEPFVLETEVEISPETNTKLMGLYRSNGVWCTQCEPEGFRRITYFIDRPDNLALFEVTMTADAALAPILLANGNLVDEGQGGDGRHFARWVDPFPKPSYLFAMVAGDLGSISDRFVTRSGREVALNIYCEHGKQDQCTYAMDALKRSMAWDEVRFGREYDLDLFNIVAVSDFNFGAMENKGLNIFNDRYVLAKPETATDLDYAHIESVIAHEYFHNWTGNRVTCRDWFQLCLKEGLTVFRDQEFTSDERSRAVKRIEDVRTLRAQQFPEDQGPLAHPARPDNYKEINNFYTATVYEKGAEIVRMLHTLLGEADFRRGTDLYFERHDGQATTIEAWLKVFEDATGRDLSQFGIWYRQAGTPVLTAHTDYDAAAKRFTVDLSQQTAPTPGQPDKAALVMPLRFGLVGPNGADMGWSAVSGAKVDGDLIVLDRADARIVFEGVSERPVLSLNRGFSTPVTLKTDLSPADDLFLAGRDRDAFNRWQAMQDVAGRLMTEAVRSGEAPAAAAVRGLADALADTLAAPDLDPAFKALMLALPGEAVLARLLEHDIDPDRIHNVRQSLMRDLSLHLDGALTAAYLGLATNVPYRQDMADVQRRALRAQCLGLLVAGGSAAAFELAESHYRDADNMTDRMAALSALNAQAAPNADALMGDFRTGHTADPLVFDKWLGLVAMAPDAGVLARMDKVLAEPDFPRNNPNRLRSLVGTFAMNNGVQFGRADGAGFDYVARFAAEVDGRNPQVAARILTAFRSYLTYEPGRRAAARKALEWLDGQAHLSRNTRDILTRTLAAGEKT